MGEPSDGTSPPEPLLPEPARNGVSEEEAVQEAGESEVNPTLLLGWEGNEPIVVRLVVEANHAMERHARLSPRHRTVERDLVSRASFSSEAPIADTGAAEMSPQQIVARRRETLLGAGFVDYCAPASLETLPPPPAPVAEILRDAWVPFEQGDQEVGHLSFGGLPELPPNAQWPGCMGCGSALDFVAEVPTPLTDERWQVFMCSRGGRAGSCTPRFSIRRYARMTLEPTNPPIAVRVFKEQTRRRWRRVLDAPARPSMRRAGLAYRRFVPRPIARAHNKGTKLGGWPSWNDFDKTPTCNRCGGRMAFRAQLAGGPAELMWGAPVGTLLLFECEHCAATAVVYEQ